jgi:hypothetical protein
MEPDHIVNPFANASLLNSQLETNWCRQIYFEAIKKGIYYNNQPEIRPQALNYEQLRAQVRQYGNEILIPDPAQLSNIFKGVTTEVYKLIERLYCSHLNLSGKRLWQIINRLGQAASIQTEVDYIAIWAICSHLAARHETLTRPVIKQTDARWHLVAIHPDRFVSGKNGEQAKALILCMIDIEDPKVIAFRVSTLTNQAGIVGEVLYEAFSTSRRPSAEAADGLVWELPQKIISEITLSEQFIFRCARLGIEIELGLLESPFVKALRDNWTRDMARKTYPINEFAAKFNTYLNNIHGYGPYYTQAELKHRYAYSVSYQRDPAWQLPLLRDFLVDKKAFVTPGGFIVWDDRRYDNDLLAYWSGAEVSLRQNQEQISAIWVYFENEILCQASLSE